MPASYLMSWEPTRRRWWKMDSGQRFAISVRQLRKHFNDLSIPETKEGSYQWANRWWMERDRSSMPSTKREPKRPLVEIDGMVIDDPTLARAILALAYHDQGERLPDDLTESIIGKPRRAQLRDGLHKLLNPVQVPPERTVGALAARYLEMVLSRHKAGEISVAAYSNASAGLRHFQEWVKPETSVDDLNAEKWDGYYRHLIGKDGPTSVETRRKDFTYARNFLTWMDDLNIHPAPKNLNRKQYRFKGGSQAVPTMPVEVVKNTVDAATGQLRLHILLMLNCGFTQQDISDLHPSEIDWEHGRIRRKRSKTGDHDKVPVVDYLLWSETFALLKQYRSASPDHALTTQSGKAWIRDSVGADGKRSRTDGIHRLYRDLEVDGKQPLKMFRKASSTIINNNSEHGKFATHFLGHALTVAHKSYVNQNGAGFDNAVKWLGEQYGF